MPYVTVGQEILQSLLHEGRSTDCSWIPLNGHSWEKQVLVLLNAGYRVVPTIAEDLGILASLIWTTIPLQPDLNVLMTKLDLR